MAESERMEYPNQIDWNDNTALTYSFGALSANIIEYLICAGADIKRRDCFGITPLMEASHFGCTDIMDCLITNGADVISRNILRHSILEHIGPLVDQEQLDLVLRYDFETTGQDIAVLVDLGADPKA